MRERKRGRGGGREGGRDRQADRGVCVCVNGKGEMSYL